MYSIFLPIEGWIYEDSNEFEMYGVHRDEQSEFNKRQSVTHVATGRVENAEDVEDEDTTKFTSHFCFPFDYQFLAKATSCKFKILFWFLSYILYIQLTIKDHTFFYK